MPEVQKPVLEHSPTEAKNQEVAEGILPESYGVVKPVTTENEQQVAARGREALRSVLADQSSMRWLFLDIPRPSHQ